VARQGQISHQCSNRIYTYYLLVLGRLQPAQIGKRWAFGREFGQCISRHTKVAPREPDGGAALADAHRTAQQDRVRGPALADARFPIAAELFKPR
jgi:hypothetical protein